MTKKLHENMYVARSHVFDLFSLIFQIGNVGKDTNESFNKIEDQLNEWLHNQQQILPEDILEEIDVFFHPDSFFGLSFIQTLYQKKKHASFEECLAYLKSLKPNQFIQHFFHTGHNLFEDQSIIDDHDKVYEYIHKSTWPLNEKSKLFYLYFDKEATQKRFIRLIKYCYEHLYKPYLDQLERHHEEGVELISQLSAKQYINIINFNEDAPIEKLPKTVVLVPSYYHQQMNVFSYDSERDMIVCIVGIELVRNILHEDNTEEKVLEFTRALSDTNRIKIIQQLNKGPHYGYELAQRLNLTSPTISHHMALLFRLDLVTSSKFENKIYYEVNKERLKQYIHDMVDLLT